MINDKFLFVKRELDGGVCVRNDPDARFFAVQKGLAPLGGVIKR